MKRISEITRRDVFNLFLYGIDKNTDFGTELLHYNYSGKLSELDFLKRIYNLEQLPSYDASVGIVLLSCAHEKALGESFAGLKRFFRPLPHHGGGLFLSDWASVCMKRKRGKRL